MRMNIRTVKRWLWLLSVLAFAGAGYKFYDILEGKKQGRYEWRDPSDFEAILRSRLDGEAAIQPEVFYSKAMYEALWEARIDGSMKPKKPKIDPAAQDLAPVAKTVEPIDTVLKVGMILWSDEPLSRFVAVAYTEPGGGAPTPPGAPIAGKIRRTHLTEGESLKEPYDEDPYFGSVVRIDQQTVTFSWAGEEVVVTPGLGREGTGIPLGEFDVALWEDPAFGFEAAPEESVEVEAGVWIIGTKDRETLARDSQRILNEDLTARTVTPSGGGRSYIELKKVASGSLVSSYGLQSGDRIISVNGIPMPSIPAALNWYEANDHLPTYDILYERRGTQKHVVIHVK